MKKLIFPVFVFAALSALAYEVPDGGKKTDWQFCPWPQREAAVQAAVKAGNACDMLFVGDSILDFFYEKELVRNYYYGERKLVNFAIGGDTPEHILWRIAHCPALTNLSPKVCLVNSGVNEMWKGMKADPECVERAVKGAVAVCKRVHALYPDAKILYFNLLQARRQPSDFMRATIKAARAELVPALEKLGFVEIVKWPDEVYLEKDGSMRKSLVGDYVHPTEAGYALIAEMLEPKIAQILGDKPKSPNPLLKLGLEKPLGLISSSEVIRETPSPVPANVFKVKVGRDPFSHVEYAVECRCADGTWQTKLPMAQRLAGLYIGRLAESVTSSAWRVRFGTRSSGVSVFEIAQVDDLEGYGLDPLENNALDRLVQISSAFVSKTIDDGSHKGFKYCLHEPMKLAAGEKVPLVVFLHGAGERGGVWRLPLLHGMPQLVNSCARKGQKAFFVAGHVPKDQQWVNTPWGKKEPHEFHSEPSASMASLIEVVEGLLKDPRVDTSRVYVTGVSMGGYGTWDLAMRRPEWFAAAMPVCGGAANAELARIKDMPIWVHHGGADNIVPTVRSQTAVEDLKKLGSPVKYTEYPGVGHNSWDKAFADDAVLDWLFSQHK